MNNSSFLDIFDFDLERVVDLINRSKARTVGLQFPEGFKRQAFSIARELEDKTGTVVMVSGNPCFGACDVDMALKGSVDILFHFGHSELVDGMDNVIFMETPARVDIGHVVEMAGVKLDAGTVGLVTTVQHVHQLDKARDILGSKGMSCVAGTGDSRIKYPGQLLGCNFSAAEVKCDSYLYIGSGKFHPLGVAVATGSKVLAADPMLNTVEWVDPERILRQRGGVIATCLDAISFGIIVSTKIGQERMVLARRLAELAKKHCKEHIIISLDNITPGALLQFKVDAFVNTACPRIAIDEGGRFNAPVLTPVEFEIVLGERDWADLVFDEIRDDTV
ncbi:MAG: 2-(3-amino-3-carboxypropyl)histidine synthase [ANME-2 cluster archaeon]|nr:2-(3-amino-3-carboxypropyl)histidine synthase [ANME-2 cluster archaeon]